VFDRARFDAALRTRRVGRTLVVREDTASSMDDAWEALAQGLGDGATVVAESQHAGRGRAGRSWSHAPGRGLALSVALHLGCDVRQAGLLPLAAGLAVAQGCEALGARVALKWPNDVLASGRKLAGVLCELRRMPRGGEAVVVGIGLNVRQTPDEFPPELRPLATSLALEGVEAAVEDAAAAVLSALEPLWAEAQEGDRDGVLAAWSARAGFWGEPVTVRTPQGPRTGVAVRLDRDGALVLRLEDGGETAVLAGDLDLAPGGGAAS
jgi:BirA family biotin operon repressor/biotin-[acetyl-CoA-carboxylase] ligase